jgi:hypothetical protein
MIIGKQRIRNGKRKFGVDPKGIKILVFVKLYYCLQWPGVEGNLE